MNPRLTGDNVLRPHATQTSYWNSPHRFNTVPAGRRSGKTELAKRKLKRRAMRATTSWVPRFFAAAPTRDQAKRIFWDDLKAMTRSIWCQRPSESDLMIEIINGAQLWVIGLDKPQRMEGQPWDGGVVDEIGNTKANAWPENIRPALSDRLGWCDLIGVPEGRNHYFDLDSNAIAQMKELGSKSEWGHYSWPSRDILPPEEIASAMRDLDELTFQQEYEASFVNFSGRAYYPFTEVEHCAPLAYNPKANLVLCFDFNVDPGVCAVIQEQILPGKYERNDAGLIQLDKPVTGSGVIGEVYIPRNSNTPAVCRRIAKDWGTHTGRVFCYGDATGGARGSAKVEGSDWDLIERELRPVFKERLHIMVEESNPPERSRINAVNSRLKTKNGTVRMMVDGKKAPHVVKDLEGVTLLEGGSGELDKDKSPELTHISDALGYYVEQVFPIIPQVMHRITIGGV